MKDNALISGGHRLQPHEAIGNVMISFYKSMGGDPANWNDEPVELKMEYHELALRFINEQYLETTQPDRQRCTCQLLDDQTWDSGTCVMHEA
jgi:hypothetical protein